MFKLPHWTWIDNIRSVIWDWKQRSAGHSREGERPAGHSCEGERPAGHSSVGRDLLVPQADLLAPRVCSPAVALLHKKGHRHRRKICANTLWLYSSYTQSSPSKNKDINYIFIYLRVFRCSSCGAIYYTLY